MAKRRHAPKLSTERSCRYPLNSPRFHLRLRVVPCMMSAWRLHQPRRPGNQGNAPKLSGPHNRAHWAPRPAPRPARQRNVQSRCLPPTRQPFRYRASISAPAGARCSAFKAAAAPAAATPATAAAATMMKIPPQTRKGSEVAKCTVRPKLCLPRPGCVLPPLQRLVLAFSRRAHNLPTWPQRKMWSGVNDELESRSNTMKATSGKPTTGGRTTAKTEDRRQWVLRRVMSGAAPSALSGMR